MKRRSRSRDASSSRLPRAERRQQLLDVGREVFAERGLEGTALSDVAERAGVTRPILYSHFGDKRGLFDAVVTRELERVQTAVSLAIAAPGAPREILERALRAFFTYVEASPHGHAVLSQDAPATSGDDRVARLLDVIAQQVTSIIRAGARDLGLDAQPAPIYANALVGLGAQVGRWWRNHPEFSLDTVTEHTTALVWNGLEGLTKRP